MNIFYLQEMFKALLVHVGIGVPAYALGMLAFPPLVAQVYDNDNPLWRLSEPEGYLGAPNLVNAV